MCAKSLRRYETPLLMTGKNIPAATAEILRRKAGRVCKESVRGPTEGANDEYLMNDLHFLTGQEEIAEHGSKATDVRLSAAIDAKYPFRIGRATQLAPAIKVVVGAAIIVALSSATSSYFGTAAIPYLALIAVLAVYAYHQNKIEFLERQIEIQHDVLTERMTELEVTVRAPERQVVLKDLDKLRSGRIRQDMRHLHY